MRTCGHRRRDRRMACREGQVSEVQRKYFGYKCDNCEAEQEGMDLPEGWKTFVDSAASDFRYEEMAEVDLCAACVSSLPTCMHHMKAEDK